MPKEIITLQLGHSANFVGTHFWNTQDSYFRFDGEEETELDHDVLYRAGRNLNGEETYTPRALISDLKGSFGSLKKVSPLYETDASEEMSAWGGKVDRYVQDPYPKNQFLEHLENPSQADGEATTFSDHLDKAVTVWSDYNKIYYHPKSLLEVPHYIHDDDQNPFSVWTQGLDVMTDAEFRDECFDERLRFFVEECDSLQGFNILADAEDGFSGIAGSFLNHLSEEFPKKASITFGIHKPPSVFDTEKSRYVASANSALLLNTAARTSSLYVPIYAPSRANVPAGDWSRYVKNDLSTPYQWSAYLSVAIETALLPVRIKKTSLQVADIANIVNGGSSRTVATLSAAVPFAFRKGESYESSIQMKEGRIPWMVDLTQRLAYDTVGQEYGQYTVVRGVGELGRWDDVRTSKPPSKSEVEQALSQALKTAGCPSGHCFAIDKAMPIGESFPQLFTSNIDGNGFIVDRNPDNTAPHPPTHHIASLCRLSQSPRLAKPILAAQAILAKLTTPVAVLYEKGDNGLAREEWVEVRQELNDLADMYLGEEEI
ncbi:Misato segment II tubulin-like domain-containing protein [Fimicolochytrium jonesii]|uniref:Misato segment II tubulin-like domain-containing protein n=1 Tax=Fimicolochytrium jonesii TaxID=1396493 RepID=UPI0022FEE0EE|nr:Misato segment II tubulin-like domain-containing protein [Fimicolochytrium jonesii]KAI8823109.1 Misato segment II tubulin-like domain-containing protein [Fimicolochytrium jonesii]